MKPLNLFPHCTNVQHDGVTCFDSGLHLDEWCEPCQEAWHGYLVEGQYETEAVFVAGQDEQKYQSYLGERQ